MTSGTASTPTKTPQGYTKAVYLTDHDLNQILDGVCAGMPVEYACHTAGTSALQFHRRCKRDPLLNERYQAARAEGYPNLQAIIESEVFHQAVELKNWKALEKLAMVHLPEWAVLRTQRYEHAVEHTVQLKQQILEATEGMTLEEMKAALQLMEAKQGLPLIEQQTAA